MAAPARHEGHLAIWLELPQQGVHVVFGRDTVENEIERAGMPRHVLGAGRHHHIVGAQSPGIIALVRGRGEHHHLGAKRLGKLDAHVAKSTKPHHTHLVTLGHAEVAQR